MAEEKVAAVVGVGPGLGRCVALRFAREGYAVALMARQEAALASVAAEIERAGGSALSLPVDATQEKAVAQAFKRVRENLGDPGVLVYNAGAFKIGGLLELDPETFEKCWQINCQGAFLAARQVLPAMQRGGEGTVILTGATAARRGGSGFAGLAVGKFGLRALAQSMAREFGPQGIHVAHPIIDGMIDTPRIRERMPEREDQTLLDPEAIAEAYWQLHTQSPTAWTLELDLRPAVEKF
jgi:NAD(P)-dependent dehydrogenase (short-subunit alcohol dehydrogenase family)